VSAIEPPTAARTNSGDKRYRPAAVVARSPLRFVVPLDGATGFGCIIATPSVSRGGCSRRQARKSPMEINFVTLQPWVALAAGILILIFPRLLNYIVAIYLIIVGASGLLGPV
jgi:hypothetical protein